MNWSPWQVVLALLGGLALAGITGWIKRARLIVFVPRLFSYSMLTVRGHLAEVSVFNRGMKTEEAVEVNLNPLLKYEIVGSNNQDARLADSKIVIPRIGAGDETTMILLVEGERSFAQSDIVNCLSRETKGRTISALDQVPSTWQQRVGGVFLLILLPATFYLSAHALDYVFENSRLFRGLVLDGKVEPDNALPIRGWVVPEHYRRLKGDVFRAFDSGAIDVVIGQPSRARDLLTIPFTVMNRSDLVLSVDVSMKSQRSIDRIPTYKLRSDDILTTPGATATRSIVVVVPKESTNPYDRKVYIEAFIQDTSGGSLKVTREYVAP